jgi:transposase
LSGCSLRLLPLKRVQRVSKAEERFQKRKTAVEAVRNGEAVTTVARVLGEPVRSIFRWVALYRQGGEHALKEGGRSGRPSKVSADVMQRIYDSIAGGDPRQFDFPFFLWTLAIVRTMLKRDYGIELSKSGVSKLLRHLGLSPQRPLYKSYKQDPQQVDNYLKRTFPRIRRLAKARGAVIYFVDEASVRADAHRGTTWSPIGETPVLPDSGDRFGARLISAVSPRGDMKFMQFEGEMNEDRFIDFLVKLQKDTGKPIIVIADNASYHTGSFVRACVRGSKGLVSLINLPAYSPELNPDEQVWNQMKAQLGKLFIESKEQLVREVINILRSIQRATSLVCSFFQLKDTKYAAASC